MRYEDLIVSSEDLPPTEEWLDAMDVVVELMKLVEAGDTHAATQMLKAGLPQFPALLDCFLEALVDRLAKVSRGAPKKNHYWYLLRIYDSYRLETSGPAAERHEQLAAKFGLSVSTIEKLLKQGRKLGKRLAAASEAEWVEHQAQLRDGSHADESLNDTWDSLFQKADGVPKPGG